MTPALALLAACGKAPGKIRLALNWKPDPQFGGFYAAPYQAHGLDVDILTRRRRHAHHPDGRRGLSRIRRGLRR